MELAEMVKLQLPATYPTTYPVGINLKAPAFVASPKELGNLNKPVKASSEIKDYPARVALLNAINNDFMGAKLYDGESAANGGAMPLSVALMLLALVHQAKRPRWVQTLAVRQKQDKSNGTLLQQIADLTGRYVILRDGMVTLTTDFYGEVAV
jgi:hypothetical protein